MNANLNLNANATNVADNQLINPVMEAVTDVITDVTNKLETRVLSTSLASKAIKVEYTRKEVAEASKKLKHTWLEAEGSLNSRVKWLIDNKESSAVVEFFAKMGLTSKVILTKSVLTPALIIEGWATREEGTDVCMRARTYYKEEVDAEGKKVVDFYIFEPKKVWTIGDVVRMLQRIVSKKMVYTHYIAGVRYVKINGKFVVAPEAAPEA